MRSFCLLVPLLILLFLSQKVFALDSTLDTGVLFSDGLAIVEVTPLDYGTIGVSGGGNNDITIDPANGNLTCSNNTNYDCPTSGVRGSFRVAGTPGSMVDLSCQRRGEVTNGTDTFRYNQGRMYVGSTTYTCSGLGNVATGHLITGQTVNDTAYIGARLRIQGTPSLGVYTTTDDPIAVRVLYQ